MTRTTHSSMLECVSIAIIARLLGSTCNKFFRFHPRVAQSETGERLSSLSRWSWYLSNSIFANCITICRGGKQMCCNVLLQLILCTHKHREIFGRNRNRCYVTTPKMTPTMTPLQLNSMSNGNWRNLAIARYFVLSIHLHTQIHL